MLPDARPLQVHDTADEHQLSDVQYPAVHDQPLCLRFEVSFGAEQRRGKTEAFSKGRRMSFMGFKLGT